jgi:hypothetical protein
MWCWKRVEKITWTERVRNEEALSLHGVKEDRNIVHTKKEGRLIGFCHILRMICLLEHVIERKIKEKTELTGRRGRRLKPLLDDLKER